VRLNRTGVRPLEMKVTAFITLLFVGCRAQPERPVKVPAAAVRVSGDIFNVWIQCSQVRDERATFDCVTFNDKGEVTARGRHVHATYTSAGYAPVDPSLPLGKLEEYDGCCIIDLSDQTALVPDGWLEYRLEPSQRVKQQFRMGKEVSEAIPY
jgi:hypothetical protein